MSTKNVPEWHRCTSCKGYAEWYTVKDKVWLKALPTYEMDLRVFGHIYLCLKCLRKRLGRALRPNDFRKDLPINDLLFVGIRMGRRSA